MGVALLIGMGLTAAALPTRWQPTPGTSFQWQLGGPPLDHRPQADVYDIDLFDHSAAEVRRLRAAGRRVICYVSAGSLEDWRPDAARFPRQVIGKAYAGWPGERWLDIRRIDLLAPLMRARLDRCRALGFDGVEPDNIDGYNADTGFPLTREDQVRYNLWLANEAHRRGLSIGLKNVPELAARLEPTFDWALTEDCAAQGWCDRMAPFVRRGKAVFMVEYTDTGVTREKVCRVARQNGFFAALKRRELDAWRRTCPPSTRTTGR